MEAANMTFREEVVKLRSENKYLRIENTNLKKRVHTLTQKVQLLSFENQQLRLENRLLKQNQQLLLQKVEQQEKQLESLKLIIEELRGMVFGKKKKPTKGEDTNASGDDTNTQDGQTKKRKAADRSPMSYRRSTPTDSEVTATIDHPITHCPDCGTLLLEIKTIIRYIEDLADLTELSKLLKKVEKHLISSGYCPTCKKRRLADKISPQVTTLGENVRQFVCYLNIVMRLSFEQISCFLSDTAGLHISDGEITECLDQQSEKLIPEKDQILTRIRGAPGRHYDETGWKVQQEGLGNYAWITRPTAGEDSVFLMGRSRGKGSAEELQGEVDNQVGISDDYAAYDNLFAKHQLCMAHPQRKLRDLSESKTLSGESRSYCTKSYNAFSGLYGDLEKTLSGEYQKEVWLHKHDEYIKRLKEIATVTDNDPDKLKAIKRSLNDNTEKYFTCLEKPGIPCDNNKAERGLRHLVLKRKSSYGSKTQKGADTMSILASTLLSCWWSKPKNFFVAYNQMLTP